LEQKGDLRDGKVATQYLTPESVRGMKNDGVTRRDRYENMS